MSERGFRADLNGLRGISVALVIAYHLQAKGSGGGFIGVDVFFVISGYLMTQICLGGLTTGRFSYWRFIVARAARIWPALAAMVVLLFAAGAVLLPPFDLQILATQAGAALAFVSNHYFLGSSGYITHAGDTHWLLHTWSLSVEWQFYLLYPLLLMALARVKAQRRALLWTLVVLAALSLGFQVLFARSHAEASFFLLPGRCWELFAGGIVYLLHNHAAPESPRWPRVLASYAGLALIMCAALAIAALRLGAVGIGAWLVLPVIGAMLVLWGGHQGNIVLRNPALQRLGLWSYSAYLWHWPIIIGLRMTEYPMERPVLTMCGTVVASLTMGYLSYAWVERPGTARVATTWKLARKPAIAMLLGAGVALAAAQTDGFASRMQGKIDFYSGYWASVKALYFPDECSNYKKPADELKMCQIHKREPARILVIGDSHAEHFYAWFAAHSPGSVDFFTVAECPPVPNFERLQPGYACMAYAAMAWRKALEPSYDTVIVSARWPTIGLAGAPYCHQGEGKACSAQPLVSAKQGLIIDDLKAAIAATLKAGKTVVMVDDAPESALRVPERLAREQFWFGDARLTVPRSDIARLSGWLEPVFDAFRGTPGFHRVSVRDRLCNQQTCRVFDAQLQRPIYIDESHFDPVWIASQADLFAPFVH